MAKSMKRPIVAMVVGRGTEDAFRAALVGFHKGPAPENWLGRADRSAGSRLRRGAARAARLADRQGLRRARGCKPGSADCTDRAGDAAPRRLRALAGEIGRASCRERV